MKIIKVQWVDASSSPGWQRIPNSNLGITECESVGYLVYENYKTIQLAQSVGEQGMLGDIITIPKVNITHRKVLK